MKKIALCPKCRKPLFDGDVDGYPYTCYECDENFYEIEIREYIDEEK